MNFQLMKHHGWSLYDLEHMLPFERDIYVILLTQYLKDEAQKDAQRRIHGQQR
jgi:hypothetical protein